MWLMPRGCCRGTGVTQEAPSLPRALPGRVACGSLCSRRRRRRFRGEDRGQVVDVDLVEHAPALRLLEPRDELCAQDVDLPVQQSPLVGDLVLLAGQVVDQLLQVLVAEACEIGE